MSDLRGKWLDVKHSVLDKWDEVKANPKKLLIVVGVVFFVLGVGVGYMNNAHAQGLVFHRGGALTHMLSVCLDKQDAVEIVKADAEKGQDAAAAAWDSKTRCATVPVTGAFVGKAVFSAQVVREGKKLTASVVEILDKDGAVLGYFLTSGRVVDTPTVKGSEGPIQLKPERNA